MQVLAKFSSRDVANGCIVCAQEKNNVVERREKIKEFLATNGMIKGHAGAISRTPAEAPPEILALRFNGVNAPGRHGSGDNNTLPPLGIPGDQDRRRIDNALLNFAYVASDAQPFGHLSSGMGGMPRSPLDMSGAHMLPPLTMPLGTPGLDGPMGRDVSLSDAMGGPSPLDSGMGGYGLPEFSTPTDTDVTVGSSGTSATVDGSGRSIVSLQNSTCKSPSPSCTTTSD